MIYIVAIIIALAIIGAIIEWLKGLIEDLFCWIGENILAILVLIGLIVIYKQYGLELALKALAVGAAIWVLAKILKAWMVQRNERKLKRHLMTHCLNCGYMTFDGWKRILPDYAGRTYPKTTSFYSIVDNFTAEIERKYIVNDKELAWLMPAVSFLKNTGMADVGQLAKVPSKGLSYTHGTPNEKLIYDTLERLRVSWKIDDDVVIEKIVLGDEAVRKDMGFKEGATIPEYYKAAYKISSAMITQQAGVVIESEELSLDDL